MGGRPLFPCSDSFAARRARLQNCAREQGPPAVASCRQGYREIAYTGTRTISVFPVGIFSNGVRVYANFPVHSMDGFVLCSELALVGSIGAAVGNVADNEPAQSPQQVPVHGVEQTLGHLHAHLASRHLGDGAEGDVVDKE